MKQINSRIMQRRDSLSNWVSNDIVLLDGELAVVDCGQQTRFKIGNGLSSFNQLPFADQFQLSTKWLAAEAISQGIHAKSVPYGLAAGAFLSANANFSQALGYGAETVSSDQYSFVWSGDSSRAIGDYYTSHGPGSFSINPADGMSGFWIGDENLHEILSTSQNSLSSDITSWVDEKQYLSAVPNDYKTYDNVISTLSDDGYATTNALDSTFQQVSWISSLAPSAFSGIESPQATVRSIQQTLTQILDILKGQVNS